MDTGNTATRPGIGHRQPQSIGPFETAREIEYFPAPPLINSPEAAETQRAALKIARRGRSDWFGSLAVAALVHIGLLVALGWVPPIFHVGAGGIDREASSVEVTLVPASAFESLRDAAATPASATSMEAQTGQLVESPTAPPTTHTKAQGQAVWTEPLQGSDPAHPDVQKVMLRDGSTQTTDDAVPARVPGGSLSRGVSVEPTMAAATVIASAGQVAAYASTIAEALGRTRPPKQAPDRGTVRVVFAVGEDGALADIQIKATSGRPSLDALAVVAVRQTRFPPPPPGMTPSQRTYEVPYHFR